MCGVAFAIELLDPEELEVEEMSLEELRKVHGMPSTLRRKHFPIAAPMRVRL